MKERILCGRKLYISSRGAMRSFKVLIKQTDIVKCLFRNTAKGSGDNSLKNLKKMLLFRIGVGSLLLRVQKFSKEK